MTYKDNYLKEMGLSRYDIFLCEMCGEVAVDIHHIDYKSQGGTDSPSNLIALCRNCHDKAHHLRQPYLDKKVLESITRARKGNKINYDY